MGSCQQSHGGFDSCGVHLLTFAREHTQPQLLFPSLFLYKSLFSLPLSQFLYLCIFIFLYFYRSVCLSLSISLLQFLSISHTISKNSRSSSINSLSFSIYLPIFLSFSLTNTQYPSLILHSLWLSLYPFIFLYLYL